MRADRSLPILAALLVAALAGAVLGPGLTSRAQGQSSPILRSDLMRQKLELSKEILEGLTRGDFDIIAGNAKKLKVISESAVWAHPVPPDLKQYQAFLEEFRRGADDLGHQAQARNLEKATLAYSKLTFSCVECHKFVRDERHATGGNESPFPAIP